MLSDQLFTELMNQLDKNMQSTPGGETNRNYQVLISEVEKAYAYYITYLYLHEADIPEEGEID